MSWVIMCIPSVVLTNQDDHEHGFPDVLQIAQKLTNEIVNLQLSSSQCP